MRFFSGTLPKVALMAAVLVLHYSAFTFLRAESVPGSQTNLLMIKRAQAGAVVVGMFDDVPTGYTQCGKTSSPYGQTCGTCRPYNTGVPDPCETRLYCDDTGCTWYGCTKSANPQCCTNCTYNGLTDCVGCQNIYYCTFEQAQQR